MLTPWVDRQRQARALVVELTAGDDSRWSDELIAERSAEAQHE